MHGYGVGVKLGLEALEADKCGFDVCFMGTVNTGMREVESDGVHRVRHGRSGSGGWRCWSGAKVMVTATAEVTRDAEATTPMGPSGSLSVMNLSQV